MWQDPIVEEVHLEREKYAASLNFDLDAIVADLQLQQSKSGRVVVELPKHERQFNSASNLHSHL